MQDQKIIVTAKEKISTIALNEKFNNVLSPKGTLLMSFKLTVGRTSILGVDAIHNEAIISIFPYVNKDNITRDYLMSTLGLLVDYVEQTDAIKGSTLNSNKLQKMFVPLPPLAEQGRIVAEIEKFEPLIAEYDKLEQQATKLDGEIYEKLKKSILQYAIQGKLVPQDSNDEPAAVLLERIRAEKKAQLGKKYVESYIYKGDDNCYYEKVGLETKNITDEIPFDIPDSWKWTRLNSIVSALTDGTHRTPKYTTNGIPFLSVKDISSGKISFANTKFISIEEHNELKKRCNPQTGDILLTKVGTTGIPVIVDNDRDFSLFVSVALIKFNHNYINPAYFIYLLKSPLVQDQAAENTRGVGNKNWVLSDIENTLLIIPPLAEQKRIVEQINVIFSRLKDEI